MAECDMPPGKDVRYALYFRWGTFELKLTGRRQLLGLAFVVASAFGVKLLWPLMHLGPPP
jgi:hypothetical protein